MNWYIFGAVYFVMFLISPFVWHIWICCLEKSRTFSIQPEDYLLSVVWPIGYLGLILIITLDWLEDDLKLFAKDFKNPFYKERK